MEVRQEDDTKNGMFYMEQDGEQLAKMTYVWAGKDRIIIDHTEVDDRLKGQGAGRELVAKAVAFAREQQIKIVPLCPFARSVFDKTQAYQDVL